MIASTIKTLKRQYLIFWCIPLCIVAVYETGLLEVGKYAGDAQMEYMLETVGILLAIACVPLALKLFSFILPKEAERLKNSDDFLRRYRFWSMARLIILECSIVFNLLIYYFLLTNVGVLCAIISLTASFFCIPNEYRLRNELNLFNKE